MIEVSAKSGFQVDSAFRSIVEMLIANKKKVLSEDTQDETANVSLNNSAKNGMLPNCCNV